MLQSSRPVIFVFWADANAQVPSEPPDATPTGLCLVYAVKIGLENLCAFANLTANSVCATSISSTSIWWREQAVRTPPVFNLGHARRYPELHTRHQFLRCSRRWFTFWLSCCCLLNDLQRIRRLWSLIAMIAMTLEECMQYDGADATLMQTHPARRQYRVSRSSTPVTVQRRNVFGHTHVTYPISLTRKLPSASVSCSRTDQLFNQQQRVHEGVNDNCFSLYLALHK